MLCPNRMKDLPGFSFFGDSTQLKHVVYEHIESSLAKISEVFRRGSCAAVAAMVIGIDDEARAL